MGTRAHRTRTGTGSAPRDRFEVADQIERQTFLQLVGEMPHGRKSLDLRTCHRCAYFANGQATPTPADWERALAAGMDRDAVIAYHEARIDGYKNLPLPDLRACIGDAAKEFGEFVQVGLVAEREPTRENLSRATGEGFDGLRSISGAVRGFFRWQRERADMETAAHGQMDRLRPTAPQGGRSA